MVGKGDRQKCRQRGFAAVQPPLAQLPPPAVELLRADVVPPGNRGRALRSARCLRQHRQLPLERPAPPPLRSEEHTSELQSLMRISYAVFCLKKQKPSDSEPGKAH